MMKPNGIGAPVRRKEDRRFLTGRGRYVDDLRDAGELQAVFLRSPFAHARVEVTDIAEALAAPGVAAVLTGADMAGDGIGPIPTGWAIANADGTPMYAPPIWRWRTIPCVLSAKPIV